MSYLQIYSQSFGFLGLWISIFIFQSNVRKNMLYLQILSAFLFGIHFWLLWAWTGAYMNFINCIKCYIFSHLDKKWARSIIWLYSFIIIFTIFGVLSWKDWYSIFPIVAMNTGAVAFWMKNTSKIRYIALISPPMWFMYNFIVGSYPGMIGEVFIISSTLIGIYRFSRKNKWI